MMYINLKIFSPLKSPLLFILVVLVFLLPLRHGIISNNATLNPLLPASAVGFSCREAENKRKSSDETEQDGNAK